MQGTMAGSLNSVVLYVIRFNILKHAVNLMIVHITAKPMSHLYDQLRMERWNNNKQTNNLLNLYVFSKNY